MLGKLRVVAADACWVAGILAGLGCRALWAVMMLAFFLLACCRRCFCCGCACRLTGGWPDVRLLW